MQELSPKELDSGEGGHSYLRVIYMWVRYLQTRGLLVTCHTNNRESFSDKCLKLEVLVDKVVKMAANWVKIMFFFPKKIMDIISNSGKFEMFGWKIPENLGLWGRK